MLPDPSVVKYVTIFVIGSKTHQLKNHSVRSNISYENVKIWEKYTGSLAATIYSNSTVITASELIQYYSSFYLGALSSPLGSLAIHIDLSVAAKPVRRRCSVAWSAALPSFLKRWRNRRWMDVSFSISPVLLYEVQEKAVFCCQFHYSVHCTFHPDYHSFTPLLLQSLFPLSVNLSVTLSCTSNAESVHPSRRTLYSTSNFRSFLSSYLFPISLSQMYFSSVISSSNGFGEHCCELVGSSTRPPRRALQICMSRCSVATATSQGF